MRDWEPELIELRRGIDMRLREATLLAGRWQHDIAGRIDEAGLAVLDAPVESGAVPADAPPQFRDVVDRLGAGEFLGENPWAEWSGSADGRRAADDLAQRVADELIGFGTPRSLTAPSNELIELTTVRQTPIAERLMARFRRRGSDTNP